MNERIKKLLAEINNGIFEKEAETGMALLAALAGESIILLGPPGVAKSMVARRLKMAFHGAKAFEYLMSRFSTPDEIFGPVSISQLKSSDAYVRAVDGYLPTADVAFLDEIWKAGPAIQNTLLTVINEKLFRNGNTEIHLPLKLLMAASNELPAQGEGLEALWDRFVIRLECTNIQKDANFDAMLLSANEEKCHVDPTLQITNEEYAEWSAHINDIGVAQEVLTAIHGIRRSIRAVAIDGTNERRDVYVSDRRWKKIIRLLRTSAFMHDRTEVVITDLLPIYHCLWQEPEEKDDIRRIVIRTIFANVAENLNKLQQDLKEDIRLHHAAAAQKRVTSRQLKRDANKKTYNNFYYRVLGGNNESTYVFAQDFQQLPAYDKTVQQGVLYRDKRNTSVVVIRSYDATAAVPLGSRPVALARDENNIYIDGVRHEIETLGIGDRQELPFTDIKDSERDYSAEIERLADDIATLEKSMTENMFVYDNDRKEAAEYIASIRKTIAFTRQDIEKLYD